MVVRDRDVRFVPLADRKTNSPLMVLHLVRVHCRRLPFLGPVGP
jgi:hypothetical protein